MTAAQVVIVGAGPAGVRAAQALVQAGVRPIVVDSGRRDGGQIYRRQPEGFTRSYAQLYGSEAGKAEDLHRAWDALLHRIDYRVETLAWNIAEGRLHVVSGQRSQAIAYDALIVCSGATDRLMPVAGWNFAGCYSLGAAQIALKSQGCAIGSRIVFMGTGPLLYLVSAQYVKAGARVMAVLDTSDGALRIQGLTGMLARPTVLLRGLALMARLRGAGVALHTGVTPLAIEGTQEAGVHAVRWRDAKGKEQHLDCDAVALGYHLRAETQLADLARCEFRFDEASRQWLPRTDADGRSSVQGVYLAGDGARILGVDGAEAAGRLAALAALADLGHGPGLELYDAEAGTLRGRLHAMERFRVGIARAFPWPHRLVGELSDETVLCRCEVVTAGELRRCAHELGSKEINRAKAFSRVGMGRCQGRYCGHAAAEVLAQASGLPLPEVGRLRPQAPVTLLPIATVQEDT